MRAGTPAGIIGKVNKGVNEFLQNDAGRRQLAKIWTTPIASAPERRADYLKKEHAKWEPISSEQISACNRYGLDHEMQRVALRERYVTDRTARDRILVDNPARFVGFV